MPSAERRLEASVDAAMEMRRHLLSGRQVVGDDDLERVQIRMIAAALGVHDRIRYAMAAHGGELDPSLGEGLRERLQKIAKGRRKD